MSKNDLLALDLNTGVQHFLIECQPKLQRVFDSCSFCNTEKSLSILNERVIQLSALLKETTNRLVDNDCSIILPHIDDAGMLKCW